MEAGLGSNPNDSDPRDISDLKAKMAATPSLGPEIVSHIVTRMLMASDQVNREYGDDTDSDEALKDEARLRSVARLAAEWGMFLQCALALPDSDWPDGAPAALFSCALRAVNDRRRMSGPTI